MKPLSESSIIVCGIVRDAERGLKVNIPIVDCLCRRCRDFRVIVYENDSRDRTKELLSEWASRDRDRIHVLLNDTDSQPTILSTRSVNVNPFFSRRRIEKMAALRNKYMDYVDRMGWTADYLLVVDLDVARLNLGGILSSFAFDREWDCVTAFGHSMSPRLHRRYHDTYALTLWGDDDRPQTERKIHMMADSLGDLQPTDDWLRIASGFGGLAIYRFEAVRGLRYEVLPNADSRVEVHCEHFSLCQQMIQRGYDHIYINPGMALTYQKLNTRLIINKIINMLTNISRGGYYPLILRDSSNFITCVAA